MSLTQTAYASRNIIKYGGTGLIAFVLIWSITATAITAYKAAHPVYVAPTVRYGMLPKTVFPDKTFDKKNFTFEFANDASPQFSDQSKVYIIYRPNTSILALEDDKKTAIKYGFTGKEQEVKAGVYEFKNETTNKTLTMNVLEGSFKMEYPYLTDQLLLDAKNVPNKSEAITKAADFLTTGDKYSDDLINGEKKVSFWSISDGALKSVSSQAEANVVRVDFYRKNLENNLQILSPQIGQASISVLVSGSDVEEKRIIDVNFKYANIDRESYSTYPIKTSTEALDELKNGNYWPASDVTSTNVIIRKMYLAYYEPVTLTNYMQPIYVFEGDNNFVAFVSAVNSKYIQP